MATPASTFHRPDSTPVASVLLPVRDAGRYLTEALASLAGQTRRDFDVVAVDDGSVDGSAAELRRWIPERLPGTIVRGGGEGVTGALQRATAAARGRWWLRMDADDVALPKRWEVQAAWLEAHPETVAVGCGLWRIDDAGERIGVYDPPTEATAIEAALLRGDGFALCHPAAVLSAAAVAAVGGYRSEFPLGQDLDLFLRLARHGPLANVPERLLGYRQHGANTNFARAAEKARLLEQILTQAHAARGRAWDPATLPFRHGRGKRAEFHRRAARGAQRYSTTRAARRHAWAAWRLEPWALASWKTLAVVFADRRRTPGSASGDTERDRL